MLFLFSILTSHNRSFDDWLTSWLGPLTLLLICAVCLFVFIGSLVWGVKWLGVGLKREHPLIVLGGVLFIVLFIVMACFWGGCFA